MFLFYQQIKLPISWNFWIEHEQDNNFKLNLAFTTTSEVYSVEKQKRNIYRVFPKAISLRSSVFKWKVSVRILLAGGS